MMSRDKKRGGWEEEDEGDEEETFEVAVPGEKYVLV